MIVYGTNIVKRIWAFDEDLSGFDNFRRFKMNYCNAYFRRKKKKDRLYFSRLRSVLHESSDLIAFIIWDAHDFVTNALSWTWIALAELTL